LRLFRAFASMGFDDDTWWSKDDLEYVERQGKALLQSAESALTTAEAERERLTVAGAEGKRIRGVETQVDNARKRISQISSEMESIHRAVIAQSEP